MDRPTPPDGAELARREAIARAAFDAATAPVLAMLYTTDAVAVERFVEEEGWQTFKRRAELTPDATALLELFVGSETPPPSGPLINGVPLGIAQATLEKLGIEAGLRFLADTEQVGERLEQVRRARLLQEWVID